jgi:hypothetical protein
MATGQTQENQNDLVLSFIAVRQALGWIGFCLPIALIAGGLIFDGTIYPSISDSYYSAMKDVFVGAMCAVGAFLISYKGYDREPGELLSDKWVSRIAGATAIGVALLPTAPEAPKPGFVCSLVQCATSPRITSYFHFTCATTFFAMLAAFCLFLFTRTGGHEITRGKHRAIRLYRICGTILVGVILAIATIKGLNAAGWPLKSAMQSIDYMFWLESLGVWAFGISWLVRGRTIAFFTDPSPHPA